MLEKRTSLVNDVNPESRPQSACDDHLARGARPDSGCKLTANTLASGEDAARAHRGDAMIQMFHVSKIYPKEVVAVS
ncbi:MAG: hypothetical protein ACREJW_10040, partial [Candidatus Methylomirabilales bacterium]